MIVVAQFAVLKFVERRRRSRVIAAVGLIWALAWVTAGFAGLGHGSQEMATAAFVSTYALFGLGEAMLSPTVAPLVADLAPEGMAGQYNSAFALVKQLALAVGPAVGGPLGASLPGPYVVTFFLFSLGISVLAVRLGRQLSVVQDQPWRAKGSLVVARGSVEPVGGWRRRSGRGRLGEHELAPDGLASARGAAGAPVRGDGRHDRDASAGLVGRFRSAAARQVVVAVRHLDDEAAVGAAQAQAHGRGAVLEAVGDQFAGRQDAEVVEFGGEAPAGEDSGGEGTRAWGRFDSAEQLQGRVAEEVAGRAAAGRVLEDQDGHVVVVVRGDAERADQAVADHLGVPVAPARARSREAIPSSRSSSLRSTRPSV